MIWLALIIAVPVAYFAIRLLIGMTYPVHLLAKQILKNRLNELGIEPRIFSEPCLDELCQFAVSPLSGPVREKLREHVDGIAINVARICLGYKEVTPAALKSSDMPNIFWEILAKHDPARFSLDQLAKTQATNQMLEKMKSEGQS